MNNEKFYQELEHNPDQLVDLWQVIDQAIGYKPYAYVVCAIRKKDNESSEFLILFSNLTSKWV